MSFTWRSAMSRGLLSGQRRGEDRKTDDRRSETHSMLNPPNFRPFGSRLAVQGRYNQSLFHRVLSRSLQGIAERPLPCNYNVIQPVSALSRRKRGFKSRRGRQINKLLEKYLLSV